MLYTLCFIYFPVYSSINIQCFHSPYRAHTTFSILWSWPFHDELFPCLLHILFVAILQGETCRFLYDVVPLFPTGSTFRAMCYFKLHFLALQAQYLMYPMLDSHSWVFYLPVAKGANPAVYLGQYLKQRSKLYKPIVIMPLRREFWSTLMLLLWEIIVALCDFIRSPSCFKRCSLWRLKATSLADSIPRGRMNKKGEIIMRLS